MSNSQHHQQQDKHHSTTATTQKRLRAAYRCCGREVTKKVSNLSDVNFGSLLRKRAIIFSSMTAAVLRQMIHKSWLMNIEKQHAIALNFGPNSKSKGRTDQVRVTAGAVFEACLLSGRRGFGDRARSSQALLLSSRERYKISREKNVVFLQTPAARRLGQASTNE